jgi:hypothetical protein
MNPLLKLLSKKEKRANQTLKIKKKKIEKKKRKKKKIKKKNGDERLRLLRRERRDAELRHDRRY